MNIYHFTLKLLFFLLFPQYPRLLNITTDSPEDTSISIAELDLHRYLDTDESLEVKIWIRTTSKRDINRRRHILIECFHPNIIFQVPIVGIRFRSDIIHCSYGSSLQFWTSWSIPLSATQSPFPAVCLETRPITRWSSTTPPKIAFECVTESEICSKTVPKIEIQKPKIIHSRIWSRILWSFYQIIHIRLEGPSLQYFAQKYL